LERPVFEKYIQLAEWKRWLLAQPETAGALMSGSGSTVFAVLRESAGGPALAERVIGEFGTGLWIGLAQTV
jgi:4-diphosphocytidyl-2-C-methyl-D-erythritol kinase